MKRIEKESGRSFWRQHTVAAAVAVGLSIALHAILLWQLPRIPVRLPRFTERAEPESAWDPTQLFEILRERGRPESDRDRPATAADEAAWLDWTEALASLGLEPEAAALEAPPHDDAWLGEDRMQPSDAQPVKAIWQPRQDILAIQETVVRDEVAALPRRRIAPVARVSGAPDVVVPADRTAAAAAAVPRAGPGSGLTTAPPRAEIERPAVDPPLPEPDDRQIPDAVREKMAELEQADDTAAQPYQPMETLLQAQIETYMPFWSRSHTYFKIEVARKSEDVLPEIPKDIVFVQHSSTRMAETILRFCRVGLSNSVARLGPRDRFNVVALRDTVDWAFPDWAPTTPEAIAQAQTYIAGLRSEGGTDIYRALESLLTLERVPGRPTIAVLISEGHPSAGITASTDVIGRFAYANRGRMAVYALGITQTSNTYLLDLLSFSNRGEASFVTRGRWDIPEAMQRLVDSVSRPVLTDVRFAFSEASQAEVFPEQPTPLFKDRSLTLYGRVPRSVDRVVFQAVGLAGETEADMIFDLPLAERGDAGGRDLRQRWAEQKIYHLIGAYARHRDPALLETMRRTGRDYRVRIPYQDRF